MGKRKSSKAFKKDESNVESPTKSWRTMALFSTVFSLLASTAYAQLAGSRGQPRLYSFAIKGTYKHDPDAFTQGLEYDKLCTTPNNCTDVLWESTGMNGESEVRLVDLASGSVLRRKALSNRDFGEGIVRVDSRVLQLTWRSNRALSYAIEDLDDVEEVRTPLQDGWGITHTGGEGSDLVLSDGSSTLTVIDRSSLEKKFSVQVTDGDKPVRFLNELEWIKGEVWANVWQTECIARINHKTGAVRGWVLLHGLLQKLQKLNQPQKRGIDVLNGIAWDKEKRRLFLTGKYWPSIFEVVLRPHPGRLKAETIELARQRCII